MQIGTASLLKPVLGDFRANAIELVQLLTSTSSKEHKNTADIQLTVDALEMVFLPVRPDTIVIVGGDRDYVPRGGERGERCRERVNVNAEALEFAVWRETRRIPLHPETVLAGMEAMSVGGDAEELDARVRNAEGDLRVSSRRRTCCSACTSRGKITEEQLERQRRHITERLERAEAVLGDLAERRDVGPGPRFPARRVHGVGQGGSGETRLAGHAGAPGDRKAGVLPHRAGGQQRPGAHLRGRSRKPTVPGTRG
jgi:hypothetical protein